VIGRIGSCVPWQMTSAAFAPHCWNATSRAEPEYVTAFGLPNAFWAFAITVFASCANAFAHNSIVPSAASTSFLFTVVPPPCR